MKRGRNEQIRTFCPGVEGEKSNLQAREETMRRSSIAARLGEGVRKRGKGNRS